MKELKQALIERFGEGNVHDFAPQGENDFPLLLISSDKRSKITILMTNGLSKYKMPVHEKHAGREHTELYFCLPNYWDLENLQKQWVFEWIQKMARYLTEKQTWFGVGHTIPNGNPAVPLSPTMNQRYLLLNDPMYLRNELTPLTLEDTEIHFLGIIPIFEDEMDYKMARGTYKLVQKMEGKGISELLDDYRMSFLKSKWRILKR